MSQVLSFPSKKPEQDIVYFELLPEHESKARILIQRICDNGTSETEIIVLK